jgi:Phosphotransferase enzyme family
VGPSELIPAAERALSESWKRDVRLKLDWVRPNSIASHVFRVRRVDADEDLPRSLIVKAADPKFPGDPQQMLFNEWAALVFLNELGPEPPLAARFYAGAADTEMPFIVMEDLGGGSGSPDEAVGGSDPEVAEQAILDYARSLGRLHAATAGKSDRFRKLRAGLPSPPRRRPLYHDPWSDASSYSTEEIRQAIIEYRGVLLELGVRPEPGIEDEIEQVTHSIEEHQGEFLVLCQGDQNSLQHCIRSHDSFRMLDFGVSGFRHALIEGMPHRMTWGSMQRIPRRLFVPFETVYQTELSHGCPAARTHSAFRRAMVEAGGRWSVFHVIWRVPDALKADRPRGWTTLRQQVLAWLAAFAELSEECGHLSALGKSAYRVRRCLQSHWPRETHEIPYYPAFRNSG